jgi:hypothetical protein
MTKPTTPPPISSDDAESPRFLVVDPRAPAPIRQLLDEADGCLNMSFGTGGTACARKAVDVILTTEHAVADDYAASLLTLSEKHPAVAPALFQILGMLGEGDEPLGTESLKALIVTVKAIVYEIYVLGAERIERLMYVHQLVESLKRQPVAPSKR